MSKNFACGELNIARKNAARSRAKKNRKFRGQSEDFFWPPSIPGMRKFLRANKKKLYSQLHDIVLSPLGTSAASRHNGGLFGSRSTLVKHWSFLVNLSVISYSQTGTLDHSYTLNMRFLIFFTLFPPDVYFSCSPDVYFLTQHFSSF